MSRKWNARKLITRSCRHEHACMRACSLCNTRACERRAAFLRARHLHTTCEMPRVAMRIPRVCPRLTSAACARRKGMPFCPFLPYDHFGDVGPQRRSSCIVNLRAPNQTRACTRHHGGLFQREDYDHCSVCNRFPAVGHVSSVCESARVFMCARILCTHAHHLGRMSTAFYT